MIQSRQRTGMTDFNRNKRRNTALDAPHPQLLPPANLRRDAEQSGREWNASLGNNTPKRCDIPGLSLHSCAHLSHRPVEDPSRGSRCCLVLHPSDLQQQPQHNHANALLTFGSGPRAASNSMLAHRKTQRGHSL